MSYELIKKEPILEFLSQNASGNDWLLNQYNADWIYCLVASQPTIDAVPVVRCKDCKHWERGDFMGGKTLDSMEFGGRCPFAKFSRYESDFCSRGERKDGEGNA